MHHSSFISHHSFIIHSSFIIPRSSFIIYHSSFIVHHSQFIPCSSFVIHTTPLQGNLLMDATGTLWMIDFATIDFATAELATKMSSRRSALPMICLARQIRRMARRRQEQRPQRGINWRSPQWSRGVPMLQCWHLYYSVIFSRGQRGLQRTAETCGGGGSSGIDDKTRHVGLHVHSLTSEGFVILV